MEKYKSPNTGVGGWIACAAIAVAYDLFNEEQTMSQYARNRFREHPALAVGVIALSVFHLTRPDSLEKFDPISQLGEVLWQIKG